MSARTAAVSQASGMALCAWLSLSPGLAAAADTSRFSHARPGEALPAGWQRVPFSDRKKPTRYAIVEDSGRSVLHSQADASVSFVLHDGGIDLRRNPVMRWRWRIGTEPRGADIKVAARDDAAARIVLLFDGDHGKLPLSERLKLGLASRLSGRDMPYATLMYAATPSAPLGSFVRHPSTGRVQTVVATKLAGVGSWIDVQRNVLADYRLAFGEEPGKLIAFGVMSDSDNTASKAQAWFGDIHFVPRR